ncbi:aldo/keto reductase [Chloroflexota bacterium]
MEYRSLGSSGLKVSQIGLGCNNFGWRVDEQTSVAIINHALESGVTFLDTSDLYGGGKSEEFLGKALKGKRSRVVIATKFGMLDRVRVSGSRHHVMQAVENSLRKLKTDYIDLYQMHKPDPMTPIEETLRALDGLVRAGKVRYIGCSNFPSWQIADALWTSRSCNLESFATTQSEYSLLYRAVEGEVIPCCKSYGLGLIPWGPLAAGFLTGKYRRGEPAGAGTRLAEVPDLSSIMSDRNFDILEEFQQFAKERGHRVGELAIAWLLAKPIISSVISGATGTAQLDSNLAGAQWALTQQEVAEVEAITDAGRSESIYKYRKGHN